MEPKRLGVLGEDIGEPAAATAALLMAAWRKPEGVPGAEPAGVLNWGVLGERGPGLNCLGDPGGVGTGVRSNTPPSGSSGATFVLMSLEIVRVTTCM